MCDSIEHTSERVGISTRVVPHGHLRDARVARRMIRRTLIQPLPIFQIFTLLSQVVVDVFRTNACVVVVVVAIALPIHDARENMSRCVLSGQST